MRDRGFRFGVRHGLLLALLVAGVIPAAVALGDSPGPALSLDQAFDSGQPAAPQFAPDGSGGSPGGVLFASVIQPDGKLILVGQNASPGPIVKFDVARYNADGTLDTSFGTNGYVQVAPTTNSFNFADAVALDPQTGDIVIAGGDIGSPDVPELVRLTPSGALDTTFGSGGSVVDSGNPGSYLTGVVVDSLDRILTIGTDGVVRRYTATGAPDSSFGTGGHTGVVIAPGGFGTGTNALALQPADGKLLVAGTPFGGAGTIVRLNTDGSLDSAFGPGGTATLASGTAIRQMTLEGTNIVVGGNDASGNGMLARLHSNGALDTTFGTNSGYTTLALPGGDTTEHVDALFYDPGTPQGLVYCLYQNGSGGHTGVCSTLGPDGQTMGTPITIPGTPKDGGYSFTPNSVVAWLSYLGAGLFTTTPGTSTGGGGKHPDFRLRITKLSRYVGTEASGAYVGVVGRLEHYHGLINAVFTVTNDGTAPGVATIAVTLATGALFFENGDLGAVGGVTDTMTRTDAGEVNVIKTGTACTKGGIYLLPGFSATVSCQYRLKYPDRVAFAYFDAEVEPFDDPGVDNDTSTDNKPSTVRIRVLAGPASPEDRIPTKVTRDRLSEFSGDGTLSRVHGAIDARARNPATIKQVEIALLRLLGGATAASANRCLWLKNARAEFVREPPRDGLCQDQVWLAATGTTNWVFRLKRQLPPGRYVLYSRAIDRAGITDEYFSDQLHNREAFTVR